MSSKVDGRFRFLAERQAPLEISEIIELYCAAWPGFCKPPFNCQSKTPLLDRKWQTEGVAADGKPNFLFWCPDPRYAAYMTRCAAGHLVEAGLLQFALTEAGMFGGLTRENDGSYCFLEGHCVNTEVTENTTLEEAVKMCDDRFGRKAWAQYGKVGAPPEDLTGYGLEEQTDPRNGFTSRKQTRPFVLAACAMGNFHCDVIYCRETYCKNPYYIDKYGHFLKDLGWIK
eukprot:CAMPEP_0204523100 /NCGR_PEP_ID=MMETSP0661-20131031/6666_1 /ASSEMBLY_ACC=CAM_ASM_000606 /TAXON_ID=109239 /ORGANISM="Alexandrium margalefi, Strain AMGDE01CS-322" /LENGTH=227 /DNA_ID=CAMNT_0051528797 /DNA_START=199 /DNA_END=882 /DNA_ORIENTATION=-